MTYEFGKKTPFRPTAVSVGNERNVHYHIYCFGGKLMSKNKATSFEAALMPFYLIIIP
jgi:hypothetical protein